MKKKEGGSLKDSTRILTERFVAPGFDKDFLNTPLHLDIAQVMPSLSEAEQRFQDSKLGATYFRKGHFNSRILEQKLAAMEGAEDALVFCSGMAATNCLLLSLVRPGWRIVSQPCVYGGTLGFMLKDLRDAGRYVNFVEDPCNISHWSKAIDNITEAVFVEMPSNPKIGLVPLKEIAEICKDRGVPLIVDNTFAPLFFKPIDWGADIVLRSCTKYENPGNTNMLGAFMGPSAIIDPIRNGRYERLGAMADSLSCWFTEMGLNYLDLRMKRQSDSALSVAYHLASNKKVRKVYYPGLASSNQHELAGKYMPRGCGAILSFELEGGRAECGRLMDGLKLFRDVTSLGDIRSFATYPAGTTHSKAPADLRQRLGINDSLIRLSIGLEDPMDLIADLNLALKAI